MTEHDKYVAMWSLPAYRSVSPGEGYAQDALDRLLWPGASVIDFGCGTGRGATKLAWLGCNVLAVDFAENCLDPSVNVPFLIADLTELPPLRAQYGFCCDVMEHIPPADVETVLVGIARSVDSCYFSIALTPDSAGAIIGQRLHLTVESASWWGGRLREHFGEVAVQDHGHVLIAVCRK